MSARDIFHDAVKTALQKDGWTITHDPLTLEYETVEVHIDLGAEKLIAAQKEGNKIAVEIKSFLSGSAISDFHTALGQFLNYRIVLTVKAPERILFLAIPTYAYETFFQTALAQIAIQQYQLKLMVYNPDDEVIFKWIN